ncbi:MAG: HEPN domain-containing protein [Nitrospirae bacterium]|nr:HEPN domain-containing protein [Nitrospirota bacterium]
MTPEQQDLLIQARRSLDASKLLYREGFYSFAASRAYYAMFYIAEAFLLGQGLAFSKHSGVHAAFGERFAKTGLVPSEFHRFLIEGMEVRQAGDYGKGKDVSPEASTEQITRAEQFLDLAERLIGALPRGEEEQA